MDWTKLIVGLNNSRLKYLCIFPHLSLTLQTCRANILWIWQLAEALVRIRIRFRVREIWCSRFIGCQWKSALDARRLIPQTQNVGSSFHYCVYILVVKTSTPEVNRLCPPVISCCALYAQQVTWVWRQNSKSWVDTTPVHEEPKPLYYYYY